MRTFEAKETDRGMTQLLTTVQREPVTIRQQGRPVAVLLSCDEYERLEALDDAYWGERALAAEKEGYLGPEEGEKLLQELLSAEG